MLFDTLIVIFATFASVLACLPFLNGALKQKQVLLHAAVCGIMMLLCSTACRLYPALSGFIVGICFSVYILTGYASLLHAADKPRVFWLIPVQFFFCILALFLCKRIDAALLLCPMLAAPFLCRFSQKLQNASDQHLRIARAKKHLKKLKNTICVAVAGDDTAAYMLHQLLKQKTVLAAEPSAFALAETVEKLDSTARMLIYPLPENTGEATRMLRLAPCHMLLCAGAQDAFLSAIGKHIRRSAAFVCPQESDVRMGNIVHTYTTQGAENYDISVSKIRSEQDGTHFVLKERVSQQRLTGRVSFIGSRNMQCITAAVTAARLLDNSLEQIVQELSRMEPKSHQLYIGFIENGAVLIDDTEGSDVGYALQTLDSFSSRKIAVLGSYPDALEKNKQLGRDAARVAQIAILCGLCDDGAGAVQCGLLEAGFDTQNIYHVQSAAHLRRTIRSHAQSGDVFLQVLTDFNYWEA